MMDFNIKQLAEFDNLSFNERKFKESLGITGKTLETSDSALKEAINVAGKNIELPNLETNWLTNSSTLTPNSPVSLSWTNKENVTFL